MGLFKPDLDPAKMNKNPLLWAAFLLFLAGFSLVFGNKAYKDYRLDRDYQTSTATITNKKDSHSRRGGRNYYVGYDFVISEDDEWEYFESDRQRVSRDFYDKVAINDTVPVRFREQGRGYHSRIDFTFFPYWMSGLLALMSALTCGMLVKALYKYDQGGIDNAPAS